MTIFTLIDCRKMTITFKENSGTMAKAEITLVLSIPGNSTYWESGNL
ncbi:hypothetical protein HNP24_001610 [Chryseobacterium sediminis]|uniref:Uncharacterized protein n=1 Tax=Chryseobacterium sediminis TaxID=1679494 RepID=A0ABR6PY80_9FLAO|nr:hypothetical protein [Chryseobacterium sediminis]